jgi:hypothetical protein
VRLLIVLFTLTLPVPPPAGAATLTVTDCGDSGAAGQLRQVIAAATSGDTVMIPSCTIPLGTQITIGKNLVITGSGASQTVLDGGTVTRIFTLNAPYEVCTFSHVLIGMSAARALGQDR